LVSLYAWLRRKGFEPMRRGLKKSLYLAKLIFNVTQCVVYGEWEIAGDMGRRVEETRRRQGSRAMGWGTISDCLQVNSDNPGG
jgi:hypothetical protein